MHVGGEAKLKPILSVAVIFRSIQSVSAKDKSGSQVFSLT